VLATALYAPSALRSAVLNCGHCTNSSSLCCYHATAIYHHHYYSYTVDIDLKTIVDEKSVKASAQDVRKAVKKVFEDRYLNQAQIKSEKKASGTKYFFAKLAF
jgi:Ribosomal L27e protein family